MLDVALLTANASQLKYVLQVGEDNHPFYHLMLALIILSIILQVHLNHPSTKLTSLQSRMHWICRLWLRYCQWPSICSVIVGLSGKNIAYRHSSSTTSHWDACSLLAPWTFSLPDLIQLLKSRLLPPSSSSSLEPWMLTKPRMKNYSWYSIIQP